MSKTNLIVETDACPACGGYNIELIETNYGDDMTEMELRKRCEDCGTEFFEKYSIKLIKRTWGDE
jgi:transcriptional regulator NrdR family protein